VRSIRTDSQLYELEQRILSHAEELGRKLPEIRFFILDGMEFSSLLEKNVYPVSPVNIWEGKQMIDRRHRIETGQESSIFYEVVQTGRPSYAYLSHGNSPMMQATVMAHVCGHCEFSELSVLCDSFPDHTERVMHLVRKTELSRRQMGECLYHEYWNACESVVPLIAPNSQFNLSHSIDTDTRISEKFELREDEEPERKPYAPFSSTLEQLLARETGDSIFEHDQRVRVRQERLSRRGYKLRAPCQDVLAFLRNFAPASNSERAILEYLYTVNLPYDFVIRSQIMNEGWAMYWQNEIMHKLFAEQAVGDIIDYARMFAGVCYPRPFFQRNPYHLGYNLWKHIRDLYERGMVSLDYIEETDLKRREDWNEPGGRDPVWAMEHLVSTVTDYEFLRRFLTPALIHEFHLNRFPKELAQRMGIKPKDVVKEDHRHVWIDPEPIKDEMLGFFVHFYRPRIYIIDDDYQDGGLLLYHRDDGRELRTEWIKPTLRNINLIWKGPVALYSRNQLYDFTTNTYKKTTVTGSSFDTVLDRMRRDEKPLRV